VSSPPVAISSALSRRREYGFDHVRSACRASRGTRSTLCRTRELERCQRDGSTNDYRTEARGSSQKIYRVLTSRFKNAPTDLPNPSVLPTIFDECQTTRDKAQILYLYLVADDSLVRYVVHEYMARLTDGNTQIHWTSRTRRLSISSLTSSILTAAPSTMRIRRLSGGARGFRSVMRKIGVLDGQQSVVGTSPSVGDTPLLVAMDYSYGSDDEDWLTSPRGLLYLFQPANRWGNSSTGLQAPTHGVPRTSRRPRRTPQR